MVVWSWTAVPGSLAAGEDCGFRTLLAGEDSSFKLNLLPTTRAIASSAKYSMKRDYCPIILLSGYFAITAITPVLNCALRLLYSFLPYGGVLLHPVCGSPLIHGDGGTWCNTES